jgi:UDP-N-acetylglucosamine 4,6-dehydratase
VLEIAKSGEIFVPKIPTMKITDLAKAIAPECSHEIVGVRPGEKIHEILIGEDEGRNATEYNDCYVIRPNQSDGEKAPNVNNGGRPCAKGFTYSSENSPEELTIEELKRILDRISDDYSIEKSRWSMEDVPQ